MSNAKRTVARKIVSDKFGNIEGAVPLESFPLGNLKNNGRGKGSGKSTFSERSAAHKDFEKKLFEEVHPSSLLEEFTTTVLPAAVFAYTGVLVHITALRGIVRSTIFSVHSGTGTVLKAMKYFVQTARERKGI